MDTLKTLLEHKSIRKYTTQPISQSDLDLILKAAVRASTTGNMQLYSIVVSTSEEEKKQLAPAHFNQPMVTAAPVVLTFCADFNRFNQWCKYRNAEPGYDNLQSFMWAVIDTVAATQNACVAAEALGLGICYLGTTTYNAQQIIDVLNLPKGVVPITTITLGYPAEQPSQTDRLPLQSVVHYGKYADYTAANINEAFAQKEALPETQELLKQNNKENLAQVFTDCRYKKADNQYFSVEFLRVLEQQGFMNNKQE